MKTMLMTVTASIEFDEDNAAEKRLAYLLAERLEHRAQEMGFDTMVEDQNPTNNKEYKPLFKRINK